MVSLLNNILFNKCSVWCLLGNELVQDFEFRLSVSLGSICYGVESCKFVCAFLCSEASRDLGLHFQYPDGGLAGIVVVGYSLVVEEGEEAVAALDDSVL